MHACYNEAMYKNNEPGSLKEIFFLAFPLIISRFAKMSAILADRFFRKHTVYKIITAIKNIPYI